MAVTFSQAGAVLRMAVPDNPHTDAELLASFLAGANEAAFAALVNRHGPLVYGACRRLLGPGPDADDAFQGTFLVLVRQARFKTWRPALGPWLHAVAVRVSRKARATRARRLTVETPVPVMPDPATPPADTSEGAELLAAFDEELNALPTDFRQALVLCELQGRTRREAAREIGISEGTLSSRLARGRKLLRERLGRRGFGPTAAAVAGALVPAGLRAATVELARAALSGATGAVPAAIWGLTEDVTKMALMSKLKLAVGLVAAATAVTAFAAGQPGDKQPPPKALDAAQAPPIPPVVATIRGDEQITREQFAEYLIRKHGAAEIEVFVNMQIIDRECARKGVAVTADEIERAFVADCERLKVTREDFVRTVLPRYGKAEAEWRDNVVRPRLQLEKLCKGPIGATNEELREAFEGKFGEKRKVQVVIWPKGTDPKQVEAIRLHITDDAGRAKPVEFDALARSQHNESLRNTAGHVQVIGRGLRDDPSQKKLRDQIFALSSVGQLTPVVEEDDGSLILARLIEVIPPDKTKRFEDERAGLMVEVTQAKLAADIPKFFERLKEEANPIYHLKPSKPVKLK